jgi:hypothetical protein
LEMRIVLATLYGSFDVERVGGRSSVTEGYGLVMSPQGLRVRLQRRARKA